MLFLLISCIEMPESVNPLADDNDGDGYSEFEGDYDDSNSNVQCPEVHVECPDPIINLSCPEPVINLECPESVIQVEVPTPEVQVSVESPSVEVNVAGPDMQGIGDAIDDMGIAIEDALSNFVSSSLNPQIQWAHIGQQSDSNSNTWSNNTSQTAIITTAKASGGCDVYTSLGVLELNNICNGGLCSTSGWSPGTQGVLTVPIEPGGWVDCYSTTSSYFYIGGYYQ